MNHVIIGNSAAGISAAEAIRKIDHTSSITIISKEKHTFYSRCLLPDLISGKRGSEELRLCPERFYQDMGIKTLFGEEVERLYPEKNTITLSSGQEVEYHKLLIATGARPVEIGKKDRRKDRTFTIRTIEDAMALKNALGKAKRVIVVGGSLIGLKIATSLCSIGLEVTILEKFNRLLPRLTDYPASEILKGIFEDRGVSVKTGVGVLDVNDGEVKLDDGQTLTADIIVMASGVRPNVEIVEGTKVEFNKGLITDSQMRTSVDNIYAAGDVVEDNDLLREGRKFLNPIWPKAVVQGRVAGSNMAGIKRDFAGSMIMNSVEFFDTPLISGGIVSDEGDCQEEVIKYSKKDKVYQKLIFEKDQLKGAILLGKIDKAGVVINLIREQRDVSSIKEELLSANFGYGNILKVPQVNRNWII